MYQIECAKEKTKNIKFLACKIEQSHRERRPDLMTRKARYSVDNLLPLNSSPESKEMRSEVLAAASVLGIWSSLCTWGYMAWGDTHGHTGTIEV